MRVDVRFFAVLREIAGERLTLELTDAQPTVGDAWRAAAALHPGLVAHGEYVRAARNAAYVPWRAELHDGDEVAFLPPVSGGAEPIAVTDAPIRLDELTSIASAAHGAVVSFVGRARDSADDGRPVAELEYEAYAEMAEAVLREIVAEAEHRWAGSRVAVVHRTGVVPLGEAAVAIVAAAPHRAEAYEANRYVIEEIKTRLPIWKRERFDDGSEWKRPGA